MSLIKNWCGESGHETLKMALSKKWTDGKKLFLYAGTNSGNLKVDSMIYE